MTKKELEQLFNLNKEITHDNKWLNNINSGKMVEIGLPHVNSILNKTLLDNEIEKVKKKAEKKKVRTFVEYKKIMDYVQTISDSYIRQIIIYRHMYGLSWTAVARRINGGNTSDSVRIAHDRFLENELKKRIVN